MVRKEYKGGAPATALSSGIDNATLSIPLVDGTGYPTGAVGKFFIVIDRGLSTEEKIYCDTRVANAIAANALGRGADDTTPSSHSEGAKVEHVFTAEDADEANEHINDATQDNHTQYLNEARHDALTHEASRDVNYWRWVDSDLWYGPAVPGTAQNNVITDDRLYAIPFLERRGGTVDRIALDIATATGSGTAHIGIYTNTSGTPYPDALVVDSGAISVATMGRKIVTINEALTANTMYWLVFVHNAGLSAEYRTIFPLDYFPSMIGMGAFEDVGTHLDVAFTTGALPATYPVGGDRNSSYVPVVAVRYSA